MKSPVTKLVVTPDPDNLTRLLSNVGNLFSMNIVSIADQSHSHWTILDKRFERLSCHLRSHLNNVASSDFVDLLGSHSSAAFWHQVLELSVYLL